MSVAATDRFERGRRWLLQRLALAGGSLPWARTADAACAVRSSSRAASALASRLLAQQAATRPQANLVLSPASLDLALSLLWTGARGGTRAALAAALGLADCADGAPADMAPAPTRPMASATALWTVTGTRLVPGFAEQVRRCCNASTLALPTQPVAAINAWVAQATQGRIPSLLDRLPPGLRVLLVNAVHLRAAWAQPFDPGDTAPGTFHPGDARAVTVQFMHQVGPFQYQRLSNHSWLRLRYAGSVLSFDLRLPHGDTDPVGLLPSLLLADDLAAGPPLARGRLALPRFGFGASASLVPGLAASGLGLLFQASKADFSGMVDGGGLAIDDLQQSVYIAVDEAGTEAAAATSASLVGALPAPVPSFDLLVDRPFAFVLRDERDGMPLFAGIVRDPSAGPR